MIVASHQEGTFGYHHNQNNKSIHATGSWEELHLHDFHDWFQWQGRFWSTFRSVNMNIQWSEVFSHAGWENIVLTHWMLGHCPETCHEQAYPARGKVQFNVRRNILSLKTMAVSFTIYREEKDYTYCQSIYLLGVSTYFLSSLFIPLKSWTERSPSKKSM